MEAINERFRELRKKCGKTQDEWAEILGLSRSGVSEIEAGRRNVTEKHIRLLSIEPIRGKSINDEWLRTGKGEPFKELTRSQAITEFAANVIKEEDSFRARLVEALASLTEDEWSVLEEIAKKLVKSKKD